APLLLEDPTTLSALEARGFSLGRLAFGIEARSTADLASTPGWRAILETLSSDVRELYGEDRGYGVGMRFAHRGFDVSWLASPATYLALVAVVSRVDRRPFHEGTCGELRFVYRLGYQVQTRSGPFSSRLPMTVNVVFFHDATDDAGCRRAARALADPALPHGPLKSIELNVQTVRWPSTVRPDLGGHAEYLLHVFHPRPGGGLSVAPLENVPDAARIRSDPTLRARWAAWLQEPRTRQRAEEGLALLPEALAATRAISVTPRGLARGQNRPFTALARKL